MFIDIFSLYAARIQTYVWVFVILRDLVQMKRVKFVMSGGEVHICMKDTKTGI